MKVSIEKPVPSVVTPSNGTPAKQSPSTIRRDKSPKPVPEQVDTIKSAPTTPTTTKKPISPTEQVIQPIVATPVAQKPAPTVIKTEDKPKIAEIIPKFYFPTGQNAPNDTVIAKQLRQAKEELFLPKHDALHLEDFGKLAQVFLSLSLSELHLPKSLLVNRFNSILESPIVPCMCSRFSRTKIHFHSKYYCFLFTIRNFLEEVN